MPQLLNRLLQFVSVINWTTHGAILGLYYFFLLRLELVTELSDLQSHLPTLVVLCCVVQLIYWFDYWLDAKRGSKAWHHQVVHNQPRLVIFLGGCVLLCLGYTLLLLDGQVILSGLAILPLILLHQFGTYKLGLTEGWSLFYKDFFTGIIIALALGLVSLANLNEPAFSLYYVSRMLLFITPWVWANLYLQHCFDLGGTIFMHVGYYRTARLFVLPLMLLINASDDRFFLLLGLTLLIAVLYVRFLHKIKSYPVFRLVPDLLLTAWLFAE